jgi:Right handed beta helix region
MDFLHSNYYKVTMHAEKAFTVVTGGLLSLMIIGSAFGQGSLTPPGAPAPTLRTLNQVEPRGIIAQPISPATLPITIASEGSYYLTSNIVASAGYTGNGISVAASNVTVDLNGFEIVGVSGSGAGIFLNGSVANFTARNGTIRNWGSDAINAAGNQRTRVESLRVLNNGLGLDLDAGASVLQCTANGNFGGGIIVLDRSVVRDSEASANSGNGISAGPASILQGCSASSNTSHGFVATACSLLDCAATSNGINVSTTANIDGFNISSFSSITGCTSTGNTGYGLHVVAANQNDGATISNSTFSGNLVGGIYAIAGTTVTNCSVNGNGNGASGTTHGIDALGGVLISGCNISNNVGYGIFLNGANNRVVGNNLVANSFAGIILNTGTANVVDGNQLIANGGVGINIGVSAGTLVIRNVAHGNSGGNYFFQINNAAAQVVTAGANGFTNTDPTANISY